MADTIIYVNNEHEINPTYEVTSRYINFAEKFQIKDNKKQDKLIKENKAVEVNNISIAKTRIIKDNKNKITWSIFKNVDFPIRGDDTYYVVEKAFEGRPDKIAKKFYGNFRYDWVFLCANKIQAPIQELTAGKVLRMPDFTQVQLRLLNV